MDFQIVIDSNDPHRIVRFWAQALGMEIEDHHDQVVPCSGVQRRMRWLGMSLHNR